MDASATPWLLITTRANWDRLRQKGQWVFSGRAKARTVTAGDEAVVYLTQEGGRGMSAIAGHVRFTGTLQHVQQSAFETLYPYSIAMEIVKVADPLIEFKPLRSELSFLPKGNNWGSALQGQPIKQIPLEDFLFLTRQIDKRAGAPPAGRS
jgi:predicted RNA-binding protein